jgi:hypothetical protein
LEPCRGGPETDEAIDAHGHDNPGQHERDQRAGGQEGQDAGIPHVRPGERWQEQQVDQRHGQQGDDRGAANGAEK